MLQDMEQKDDQIFPMKLCVSQHMPSLPAYHISFNWLFFSSMTIIYSACSIIIKAASAFLVPAPSVKPAESPENHYYFIPTREPERERKAKLW